MHQIERALKYYGVVDVYQVHNLLQWERYLPVLHQLKDQGKVRAVGITHYAHSAFGSIMRIMERESIDCIQIQYNAADPLAAREVLPLAAATNTGVIVMSPLGSGDLVRSRPPAQEMEPLAPYGVHTWSQALLKWVVSDRRVTVTIPATSKPERARENTAAGDEPLLPEAERERVAWLATRLVR
jgi:aryl-alcohol dehydrogenase-like predicted oxidoreductase